MCKIKKVIIILLLSFFMFSLQILILVKYNRSSPINSPITELGKIYKKNNIEIPSEKDLSANFPTPRHQGDLDSCVGWTIGYAYKTYHEKLEHNWSLESDDHLYSPSYIYNQLNEGVDEGCYLDEALQLLVDEGCAPLSEMPYDTKDYLTQPTSEQKKIASKYKSDKWWAINKSDINTMKAHIANREPVAIAIPIYLDFLNLNTNNIIWDENNWSENTHKFHTVCIVGYNDSKEAVKIINSWGTDWGINGYGWISYDVMKEDCLEAYVMTDLDADDVNMDKQSDKISFWLTLIDQIW